jgi:hypothetical protein
MRVPIQSSGFVLGLTGSSMEGIDPILTSFQ